MEFGIKEQLNNWTIGGSTFKSLKIVVLFFFLADISSKQMHMRTTIDRGYRRPGLIVISIIFVNSIQDVIVF